jgi:YbbR domain-containing protein
VRLAPRHPGTLLLALVLACLLWYGVALERRARVSERQVEAAVTFVNVPAEMVITSDVPRFLLLRVRGPESRLRDLDVARTGVLIDLRGAAEGEREFTIERRNVFVPSGVEVAAVLPVQVAVRLERLVHEQVPIRPRVAGVPAIGHAVGEVTVSPAAARVFGPRLQLAGLGGMITDEISVEGAEQTVEATVAVRSPHPLVRVEDPLVVHVRVAVTAGDGRRR